MISFCKIFHVSFTELLALIHFFYLDFMGSDPMKTKLLNKEEIKTKMMELTYIQERLAEE